MPSCSQAAKAAKAAASGATPAPAPSAAQAAPTAQPAANAAAAAMPPPPPRSAAQRPAATKPRMLRLDDQGREIDEFGNVVVQPDVKPTSSLKVSAGCCLLRATFNERKNTGSAQAMMVQWPADRHCCQTGMHSSLYAAAQVNQRKPGAAPAAEPPKIDASRWSLWVVPRLVASWLGSRLNICTLGSSLALSSKQFGSSRHKRLLQSPAALRTQSCTCGGLSGASAAASTL
jgi:hypothetical protein